MKPLEVWTCQMAENLKKKSSKIPKNNYAATMVSAACRQIIGGGGGAPINKSRRRRQQTAAARPAHGSSLQYYLFIQHVQPPGLTPMIVKLFYNSIYNLTQRLLLLW